MELFGSTVTVPEKTTIPRDRWSWLCWLCRPSWRICPDADTDIWLVYTVIMVSEYCNNMSNLEMGVAGVAPDTVDRYCAGLGNQSCDVVLVKSALTWENHKGSGFLNGKQMGSRWGADGVGGR